MTLPNFFVVGTGKAGTTSLYEYLKQHPAIYMSPIKEPAYFAPEVRASKLNARIRAHVRLQSRTLADPARPMGWLVGEWDDYVRLFDGVAGETAIGDASPMYLWSAQAAENIHAKVPEARILMILRDPAERAFSQYMHQATVGLTRATFREHLEQCVRCEKTELSHLYPFLEIGMYAAQVARFQARFPRERVRIYWYEEAWRDPAKFLADVFGFLGVDPGFAVDTSRKSLERRAPKWLAAHYLLKKVRAGSLVPARVKALAFRTGKSVRMDARDRAWLVDYYREDVGKLAAMTGRDLSAWMK